MLNNKTIAVVVPCYNEETQIGNVISTMPNFVDMIIVVNDFSTDSTSSVVRQIINDAPMQDSFILNKKQFLTSDDPKLKAENIANKLRLKQDQNITPYAEYAKTGSRVLLVDHLVNGGKGAAVSTGFKITREYGIDCTAIMDGDGQMDPNELESLCMPIIQGQADYTKGNRLRHRSANVLIPKVRLFGNSVLSALTKI